MKKSAISALLLLIAGPASISAEPAIPFRDDQAILNDVKSALLADGETDSYRIAVSVYGGEVTLSGALDSAAEEREALELARKVKGVREVKDELRVRVPGS